MKKARSLLDRDDNSSHSQCAVEVVVPKVSEPG